MKFLLCAVVLAATSVFAQTPKPVPQLSVTEQMALRKLTEDANQLQAEFAAINADVKKNHPGYELDPRSLTVVPEQPKAEPKPEVKK